MRFLGGQFCRATAIAIPLLFSPPSYAFDQSSDGAFDAVMPLVGQAYTFLHENPELGKAETKAAAFLRGQLQSLGIADIQSVPGLPTAIIAVLDTGKPGPTIALRAEIDARPLEAGVEEPAGHEPHSLVSGRMHNCGHDAHTAMLLGTAAFIKQNVELFNGKFVFVFQPAEEVAGGADDIVRDGILKRLGVVAMFAQHVAPKMPVGTLAIFPGPSLAGSSYFKLKLKGRGSHAAAPHEGDDIPLLATRFVEELSYFPARRLDIASRQVLISVTKINAAGPASNVLPAEAEISGTIRAFENVQTAANGAPSLATSLEDLVARLAQAYGVSYEWELKAGAPPTVNDVGLFERIVPAFQRRWPGQIDQTQSRGMFAEDFAYYTAGIPSLYFSLGIAKDGMGTGNLHSTDFTISRDALPMGVKALVSIARAADETQNP